MTTNCGSCGSTQAHVTTSDYVHVRFWGSVHVHRQSPGSQIWTDAVYRWQEVATYQIGSGYLVQDSSRVDHLSGTGQGTLNNPLYGPCTVHYSAFPASSETEGIRVINDGSEVEAIGAPPWSLHTVSGYTGSSADYCRPPSDPAGGSFVDRDVDQITCVLEWNDRCKHTVELPASETPGTTQTGEVTFVAERRTEYPYTAEDRYLDEAMDDINWEWVLPAGQLTPLSPDLMPAPADGTLSMAVTQGGVDVATVQGGVQQGEAPHLTGHRQQAASQDQPLTVDASYAIKGGPTITLTQTIYLPSAGPGGTSPSGGSSPTITGVAFRGGAPNPMIIVSGQSLGSQPPADPSGHPSGQGGCPVVSDDMGYDFGTSLYIAVPSGNWSAGRYNPSIGETDCFDIVVAQFTPTEVVFTLGALYSQQTKDQLTAGTAYQVVVNGATFSGTVTYS